MFLHNKVEIINHSKAMLDRDPILKKLKKITTPTWVIVGEDDALFLQSTIDIANAIPNAHLEIVKHCGHMLTLEQPETVSKLMRERVVN